MSKQEQEERQTGGPGLQVGDIIAIPRPRPPDTDLFFFRLYRPGMLDNQRQGRFRTQVAALEPVPPRPLVRQRIYRDHQGAGAVAVQPGRCGRGGVQRWAELMPGGRQPRVSQTNIHPPHLRCARLRLSHSQFSYRVVRVWQGADGGAGRAGAVTILLDTIISAQVRRSVGGGLHAVVRNLYYY